MSQTFKDTWKANKKNLKLYVPVVERVHGAAHPEFHGVREQYDIIAERVKEAGKTKPELDEAFAELRKTTNNYQIPDDVCESYTAVYEMLEQLDQAYNA